MLTMEILRPTHSDYVEIRPSSPEFDKRLEIRHSINVSEQERSNILQERAGVPLTIPGLHVDTVKYRRGPTPEAKRSFQANLLAALRGLWANKDTEARFLRFIDILDTNGSVILGGLIETSAFERLISEYSKILRESGTQGFMHTYVNMADHPDFLSNRSFNDAFAHPLLIAAIAYQMGGPIRMTDARGKDTDPISVKAQDNMLHIDNTPFRNEYKVLVGWERNLAKGPSGQNFAFLPGTHRGNRDILLNDNNQSFSSERESLFVSDASVDGLFAFQAQTTGQAGTVIEVHYPEKPISVTFSAGALVHHRYRTETGSARSCVIAAYHVTDDNPGALVQKDLLADESKALANFLIGPWSSSTDKFIPLLSQQALRIELKLFEIFETSKYTTLIDTSSMALSGEALSNWRKAVVVAPSASTLKQDRKVLLSYAQPSIEAELLLTKLAAAMMYDKHGLLQLILYEDGREEIRKPSRKRIGELKYENVAKRLEAWMPALTTAELSVRDLPKPAELQRLCYELGDLLDARLDASQVSGVCKVGSPDEKEALLISLHRLVLDLGESITVRCESLENFVSTSLFMFWAADEAAMLLADAGNQEVWKIGLRFLRNYVAIVLLIEGVDEF